MHSPRFDRSSGPRHGSARIIGATLACGLWLEGCGGGGGNSGPPPTVLPGGVQELASGRVSASAGGAVEVTTGDYAGARVDVAAGAFDADVELVLGVRQQDTQFPLEFPVWTLAPGSEPVSGPIDLTVKLGTVHQFFVTLLGLEVDVFHRTAGGGFVPMPTAARDEQARTVTARIDRLGEFVALDSTFYRLLAQRQGLLNPADPIEAAFAAGADLTVEEGDTQITVGQGSLTGFWSSTAADNVLVLHGFNSSPLEFLEPQDVVAQLSTRYQNVVTYQYPSGRSIAENGLALYDEIRAQAQPGFGCSIVAHSMGGLVSRHAIEQAHLVRASAPLSNEVAVLVTLGTPHGGTAIADEFAGLFTLALPPAQRSYLQGGTDLGASSAFLASLNGGYIDNPTLYFHIAGDIGTGSDGVVTVASASQTLPVGAGEEVFVLSSPLAQHTLLHSRAQSLGVMDRIFQWLP